MSISLDLAYEWVIKLLCLTWSGGISEALQKRIFCFLLFKLYNRHSGESLTAVCRSVWVSYGPTDFPQTFSRMAIA